MRKTVVLIILFSLITIVSVIFTQISSQKMNMGFPSKLKIKSPHIESKVRKSILAINGMWCASCAVAVQYKLKTLSGVIDAYVGFNQKLDGEGWVVYEANKIAKDQIIKAVEPYKATILADFEYNE